MRLCFPVPPSVRPCLRPHVRMQAGAAERPVSIFGHALHGNWREYGVPCNSREYPVLARPVPMKSAQ